MIEQLHDREMIVRIQTVYALNRIHEGFEVLEDELFGSS